MSPDFSQFCCRPILSRELASKTEIEVGFRLPRSYLDLLGRTNGGEGFIGGQYCIIFGIEDIKQINAAYGMKCEPSSLLLVGSNGCGDALLVDGVGTTFIAPFICLYGGLAESTEQSLADYLASLGVASEPIDKHSLFFPPGSHYFGKEVCEKTPIIVGGDPRDMKNKMALSREQHMEFVDWWNKQLCGQMKNWEYGKVTVCKGSTPQPFQCLSGRA